jgi:hypothetical protein
MGYVEEQDFMVIQVTKYSSPCGSYMKIEYSHSSCDGSNFITTYGISDA